MYLFRYKLCIFMTQLNDMNIDYKGIIGDWNIKFDFNPSVTDIQTKNYLNKIKDLKGQKIYRTNAVGIIIEENQLVEAEEIVRDTELHMKIYHQDTRFLNDMTKHGIRAYTYFCSRIEYDNDKIILTPEHMCEYLYLTDEKRAAAGIRELLQQSIMYKSKVRHVYWINIKRHYMGLRWKLSKPKNAKIQKI